MGVWGTGVFSDDVAADVRDDYRALLEKGVADHDATARVLADWQESLADPDEAGVVWLALAVTQWKLGRLESHVRERALAYIAAGADVERWEQEPKLARQRARVLERVAEQLRSPQRSRVAIRKPFVQQTDLRVADAFVYRLRSGNLAAFRVVGIYRDYLDGTAPCVDLLDWSGHAPPSRHEVEQLLPRASAFRASDPARFIVARSSKRDRPGDRIAVVGSGLRFRDVPREAAYAVVTWSQLDARLENDYGLS